MRDFKFRAFKKETGQMEFVLLIDFVNKYVDVLPEANLEGGNQESWAFDEIELMQFTGLTDANGNWIYEGDIIESTASQGAKITHSIVYDESSFMADYKFGASTISQKWINEFKKKVIGNIYETPEPL